jgi:hypothetical protein
MCTIEGFPWLQHLYLIDYVHYTVVVAAYKAYVSDLLFFLFVGLSFISTSAYDSLWERLQISKDDQFSTGKIPFLVEVS